MDGDVGLLVSVQVIYGEGADDRPDRQEIEHLEFAAAGVSQN
jgi:hypothetical protein